MDVMRERVSAELERVSLGMVALQMDNEIMVDTVDGRARMSFLKVPPASNVLAWLRTHEPIEDDRPEILRMAFGASYAYPGRDRGSRRVGSLGYFTPNGGYIDMVDGLLSELVRLAAAVDPVERELLKDDTPEGMTAYADWLEEHGHTEDAQAVRDQIEERQPIRVTPTPAGTDERFDVKCYDTEFVMDRLDMIRLRDAIIAALGDD